MGGNVIKKLDITSFRGIPGKLEISFDGTNHSLSSVLLLGDNGSGKSSVAEAFEFCLRGKVSRRGNAGAKIRYEARNLLTGSNPSVQVIFGDGRQFSRGMPPKDYSGVRLSRDAFAPGFGLAPVVLSRADIDVFWQVTSADRMRFFFDYMRDSVRHPGYAALEAERYEAKLDAARVGVLEAQIALATATGKPVGQIPIDDRASFYEWRGRMYPQYGETSHPFGVDDQVRMRAINRIPANIRAALFALSGQLESVHRLRTHYESVREKTEIIDGIPSVIAADLPSILGEISDTVSADFSALSNIPHVQKVTLQSSSNGYELDVSCRLPSGEEVQPTQILSEANLDLLALLILLGVSKACAKRGQTRFLVLDDVWQSIDGIHREAILQYILADKFHYWQLMITVHDRLWARLIEDRARKHNFSLKSFELIDWTPNEGPRLRYGSFDTATQLAKLIDDAPREVLVAYTGRALEELADKLSVSLGTSVGRKLGDRYTLEDLWPGVMSKIRKAKASQGLKEAAERVNNIYDLRNLYGAHYSTWAESLSDAESREFVRSVVALWTAARCPTCGSLIKRRSKAGEIGWPCRHNG